MGTRERLNSPKEPKAELGGYVWKTWKQVETDCENFAKGLMSLDLCPAVEGEGRPWHFLGVWAKNREEWTVSLLGAMYYSVTVVGFYDAMAKEQVDYILNQTEMRTVVCSNVYARKLIEMKKDGMAQHLTGLIIATEGPNGEIDEDNQEGARTLGLTCHSFA